MDTSINNINWREIIYHGVETQELDYKAAQNWNRLSRTGKAKFARHAMAMANTRGGYVVVGVGEDENGNPNLYTGLTEAQLRSFDPSSVGQTINRYADPSIDFDIVRPEIDGRTYAIFVIRRFNTLPHVCSDSCGGELQQGVFYIRTPDARSRSAYRASEVHGLIQHALRNQRVLLGRMLRGVLYEGRQFAEPDADLEFQKLITNSQTEARRELGQKQFRDAVLLELTAYPTEFNADAIPLSEIRKAAANVILPSAAEFPFIKHGGTEAYLTNQSLLCKAAGNEGKALFFCQIFQSGLLHHVSELSDHQNAELAYPLLVRRISATIAFLGQLYTELGQEDELITFTFRLTNTEGRILTATATGADEDELRCFIPEIIVRKRRTAADLASDPTEHAYKIIAEICERFNLPDDRHVGLYTQIGRLLAGV